MVLMKLSSLFLNFSFASFFLASSGANTTAGAARNGHKFLLLGHILLFRFTFDNFTAEVDNCIALGHLNVILARDPDLPRYKTGDGGRLSKDFAIPRQLWHETKLCR